jgi:hypothetical protein
MKHYYTIEELVDFLENLDPLTIEFADTEGALDAIMTRLKSQSDHIEWMRGRLALAEHVIGELYLMQREYEE